MTFTLEQFQQVFTLSEKDRVEILQKLLGYPLKEKDRYGSRFWYIRPGKDEIDARETRPLAIGFYSELNNITDSDAKSFFTSDRQQLEIYGHYINRQLENQPVMYFLLPTEIGKDAKVCLILPTEGKLRRRSIEAFEWRYTEGVCQRLSPELLNSRLLRLKQGELTIANKALLSIPQVEWVFFESAKTSTELAKQLAKVTRRIEQAIPDIYNNESDHGYLHTLFNSFKKELLPLLQLQSDNDKEYSFADIYAQTITYGLFTARVFSYVKDEKTSQYQDFNRLDMWQLLPCTNPFLRNLFRSVSELKPLELGDSLIDAIDEVIGILKAAKMSAILSDFREKMNREDIVIRFYEDFLTAYKPKMRERRGVYYTPEPVVSYLVRSVDELIKEKFNKPLGIADPEIMILDPACGTGTFLLWIFQLIKKRFDESPELLTFGLVDKSWSSYVKERLLPRIYGFELLMAPYAICHLKLGLFLEETGYEFESSQRLGVYLTNTLDDVTNKQSVLLKEFIASESDEAIEIKTNKPITVVIGNPPYSGHSENNNSWISNLVKDYYQVDGQPLGERNPKWLQDDYVKFIRLGQWRIDLSKQGILAFITNHGFLDNPTFRGMRQQLLKSFDSIYIYDLHGNSKKKEKQADGSADANIFDIQQGVSITLGVKGCDTKIRHCHLWGSQDVKYSRLLFEDIKTTNWQEIKPQSSFYLLIPQDITLLAEYEQGWKIIEIMPINSVGIVTARDKLTIHYSSEKVWEVVNDFVGLDAEKAREKFLLGEDARDWKVNFAQEDIKNSGIDLKKIIKISYRPFDIRFTYYTGKSRGFICMPRTEVMGHIVNRQNIGLICSRQQSQSSEWRLVGVANNLVECCAISNKTKEANYIFPLYLYSDFHQIVGLQENRRPNFSQDFLNVITAKLNYTPTPEIIFYYIYAILHSPTYRNRYAEFLKIDFPRIPFTSNNQLFCQLADYGEQLVQLHLMTSNKLNSIITQYQNNGGSNLVEAAHPKYKGESVFINKKGDNFIGVPEEVWNFHVGGYQVCDKWLKDRKGRILSDDDIKYYQKIIVALQETIKIMKKIDKAIPQFPIE